MIHVVQPADAVFILFASVSMRLTIINGTSRGSSRRPNLPSESPRQPLPAKPVKHIIPPLSPEL